MDPSPLASSPPLGLSSFLFKEEIRETVFVCFTELSCGVVMQN